MLGCIGECIWLLDSEEEEPSEVANPLNGRRTVF